MDRHRSGTPLRKRRIVLALLVAAVNGYLGDVYKQALASALTVDNLLLAADLVDECNALRAKPEHNLSPVKIDYRLMCFSATSCAVSAQKKDHVVFNAYAGGAFDSLHTLLPGTMSENLAWGYHYPDYNTPFEGWYEEEKVLFDGAVASDPNLANMSAFEIYQANPTLFHQVGHYLNIVDGFMTTTGFAVSTEGGILPPTYQQSFGGNAVGETATTQEFRTDLNNFTAQKKAALETAKAAVTTAEQTFATAKTNQEAAEKALNAGTQTLNEKKTALTEAQAKANKAQGEADAAAATLTKAQAIDLSDPETYQDFPALTDAAAALETAKTAAANAETALQECTQRFETAKQAYEAVGGNTDVQPPAGGDGTSVQPPASVGDDQTIAPPAIKVKKLLRGKKSITVKWKKTTNMVTGYQIQYSLKKNFKSKKTVTIKKNTVTSKKIKKLKAKKKYYVRIRTYYKADGVTYVSKWSKAKSVKTK